MAKKRNESIKGKKDIQHTLAESKYSLEQKIKTFRLVCDAYATDTYTYEEAAKMGGISFPTLYKWIAAHKELEQMWIEAKRKKDLRRIETIRERAITALEERISGKRVTEFQEEGYFEDDPENPGQQVFVVTKRRRVTRYIQPSDIAIIFALTNTMPDRFKRNGVDSLSDPNKPPETRGTKIILPDGQEFIIE
jgi:transposase-like protein